MGVAGLFRAISGLLYLDHNQDFESKLAPGTRKTTSPALLWSTLASRRPRFKPVLSGWSQTTGATTFSSSVEETLAEAIR
jgi:hypothetical protein